MPSPFPGMNPYLENDAIWQDFHQSYCTAIRDALVPQLRPHFFVKMNEHLFVRELEGDDLRFTGRADLGITGRRSTSNPVSSTAVLEAPCKVQIPQAIDVEHCAFLEIFNKEDNSLVTVIELLSPTNKKPGKDREQFIAKRRQILDGNPHYVEVDLLRGGPRLPADNMPDCAYCVLVSRHEERPDMDLWPLKLADPLPEIPIPLKAPHAEAWLNLQALLHSVYDAAGYEDHIYRRQPQPRLHPQDAAWTLQFIPAEC